MDDHPNNNVRGGLGILKDAQDQRWQHIGMRVLGPAERLDIFCLLDNDDGCQTKFVQPHDPWLDSLVAFVPSMRDMSCCDRCGGWWNKRMFDWLNAPDYMCPFCRYDLDDQW
jgi:hypothetical protein